MSDLSPRDQLADRLRHEDAAQSGRRSPLAAWHLLQPVEQDQWRRRADAERTS